MKGPSDSLRRARQRVLTLAEAAKFLRCSEAYLRKLLAGKIPDMPPLPAPHIGSKIRIREEALEAWLLLLERREYEAQKASGVFTFPDWMKKHDPGDDDPESNGGA